VGQGKFAGQRPTFYHCATQPVMHIHTRTRTHTRLSNNSTHPRLHKRDFLSGVFWHLNAKKPNEFFTLDYYYCFITQCAQTEAIYSQNESHTQIIVIRPQWVKTNRQLLISINQYVGYFHYSCSTCRHSIRTIKMSENCENENKIRNQTETVIEVLTSENNLWLAIVPNWKLSTQFTQIVTLVD